MIDGRLANPKNKRGKTEVDLRNSAINFDRRLSSECNRAIIHACCHWHHRHFGVVDAEMQFISSIGIEASLVLQKSGVMLKLLRKADRAEYVRSPPLYEGHVPLSGVERVILAAGSAFMSLANPWRAGT